MKTHLVHVGGLYIDKNNRVFVCVCMWFGKIDYVELYSCTDDKIITVDMVKMKDYINTGILVYHTPKR